MVEEVRRDTSGTIHGHLDTFYLRSSGAHLHSAPPPRACLRGRSLAENPLSVVIATMIHNDVSRDHAKRDSSAIRDDESAHVPSSGAPLESGHGM